MSQESKRYAETYGGMLGAVMPLIEMCIRDRASAPSLSSYDRPSTSKFRTDRLPIRDSGRTTP